MSARTPFAPDRWYSAQQVQDTLSLSRSTVERLGVEGKVAAIKIGRSVRYSGDDRVIGHFVLLGLVPGVVVGGGVVEFVEADGVAPAGDDAGGLVGLTGLVPGIFEGFVGGHGRQDPRCW